MLRIGRKVKREGYERMKNVSRKLLALALMLVLIVGSTLAVNAASKSVVTKLFGFNCTGSGTATSNYVSASFKATALPGTAVQPEENYVSYTSALVKDRYGNPLADLTVRGTTTGSLSRTFSGTSVYSAEISFSFMGSPAGWMMLYA